MSPSDYPPIGDYALIGDCRIAALVACNGAVEWLCLPHFSGPAFFAAVLDREHGGRFSIRPAGAFRVYRRYIGASNVLETTFETETGTLRLIDGMTIPEAIDDGELLPQRELLRSVEVLHGMVAVDIIYDPRPDYARVSSARIVHQSALGWACTFREHLLLLNTDLSLEPISDQGGLRGRASLNAGDKCHFSLTYTCADIGLALPLGDRADQRLAATCDWWEAWCASLSYDGPYRDAVLRSVLALKLLTYALSGAVVAAPTTSLPETIFGSRNWDYRFCWLRDASFTLEAFMDLGFRTEGEAFLDWLLHATRLTWPRLQVLYDVYGEARVPERVLEHLEGYRRSRPVRIGNAAWMQRQLDVYGAVVMAAASYVRRGGRLSWAERRLLVGLGRTVCREWREADHGIWEVRGEERHHTYSKVTCWAALDCLLDLADGGHLRGVPVARFRRERDAIRAAIEVQGLDASGSSYVGVFGEAGIDASLLLLPRYRYCAPDHPRMTATFARIDRELGRGSLVYRYGRGFDRLEGDEHPFGICSFWSVHYLAQAGRVREATERFEQLLGYANDVGLYAEEIDADSHAAIGNFPQAFTHVGLIGAALALEQAGSRTEDVEHAR